MKWITHIGFSVLIFLIINNILEITPKHIAIISMIFCVFGGLLPDIDIHFKFFSKHRGLMHSIIGLLMLSIFIPILLILLGFQIVAFCFLAGYFFHLFLDSFTRTGIKWFPFTRQSRGKLKTGSLREGLLAVVIWTIVVLFTLIKGF